MKIFVVAVLLALGACPAVEARSSFTLKSLFAGGDRPTGGPTCIANPAFSCLTCHQLAFVPSPLDRALREAGEPPHGDDNNAGDDKGGHDGGDGRALREANEPPRGGDDKGGHHDRALREANEPPSGGDDNNAGDNKGGHNGGGGGDDDRRTM
ncbi:hypothetical protein JKP88DRAFT_268190 [Tribonema minus]|uniref:Uncharacterized protein n=1 Tax=Tribonema minus TaxID=303371 RepID=A0A836CHL0_9STRA|nr:hypothetical protein JKP88DRAFT_268190 [Tribonema minus]